MGQEKVYVQPMVSFTTLLAVLFIGLKLTGHVTWPWIWVLCPLWLGIAMSLAVAAIAVIIALVAALIARVFDR